MNYTLYNRNIAKGGEITRRPLFCPPPERIGIGRAHGHIRSTLSEKAMGLPSGFDGKACCRGCAFRATVSGYRDNPTTRA